LGCRNVLVGPVANHTNEVQSVDNAHTTRAAAQRAREANVNTGRRECHLTSVRRVARTYVALAPRRRQREAERISVGTIEQASLHSVVYDQTLASMQVSV
jgi:hypothetical protein